MSDKIQLHDGITEYDANVVPCKIHYTGEADTESYFTPTKDTENGDSVAYFRGCKFVGKPVDISNYTGYIIEKSEVLAPGDTPDDYKVVNTHTATGKFNNLTVYGHDRLPTLSDPYILMNQWQLLSSAIHSD